MAQGIGILVLCPLYPSIYQLLKSQQLGHGSTVHIEVADTTTAAELDRMTRSMQARVMRETGIVLAGVGVYSHNTTDEEGRALRSRVTKAVMAHEGTLQVHGFYLDSEAKELRFDVVFSFDVDARALLEEIRQAWPGHDIVQNPLSLSVSCHIGPGALAVTISKRMTVLD